MTKLRFAAVISLVLAIAPALAWGAPPTPPTYTAPGSGPRPTQPVVLQQPTGEAFVSAAAPLPVTCISGCAGGGGGGDATAANQTSVQANAGADATKVVAVQGVTGGKAVPVSDNGGSITVDGAVAATQSGTWNVTNISGTVSLPTGASTAANQSTANSSLSTIASAVQAATPAGENHVGEVGGNQLTISVAQTVTASSAYTSGNAIGGLVTLASASRVSGGSGLIQSVVLNLKSAQTTSTDVVFFSANPTGSTCTDKTAFSVAAADFDKVLGVVHVTDWTSLGTPSVGQGQNLAMPFALSSGTTIYACVVTRGTPTFTATTDVTIGIRVLRN